MDNNGLLKMITIEKEKIKAVYNQRLYDIKKHHGIEFEVEYFEDEKIKKVTFSNLKYRNGYNNLLVSYNGITQNIDYLDYDYNDSRIIKNSNHRKLISSLEKELKLVITEIERANTDYIKEIEKIDFTYQNTNQDRIEQG